MPEPEEPDETEPFRLGRPGSDMGRTDDVRETACAEELRETVWKDVPSVDSLREKRLTPTSSMLPGVLTSDWTTEFTAD